MRVWETSAGGPIRSYNEDCVRAVSWPRGGVVVVADGMGASSTTAAAEIVAEAICDHYRELPPEGRMFPASATLAVQRARDRLVAAAEMGGCTLVMLVVQENAAVLGWAGDCRAYRQRGRTLALLTRDHTLVNRMVEVGKIRAEEAETHPHRSILLRSVMAGDPGPEGGLEVAPLSLQPGDRFLLATDGVWRPLELWTLQQHMMVEAARLADVPAALVAAAHAEDGGDNAAVAVVAVSGGG